jgi:lipopolysaccharide/colanic/teichoic acid biosynthesis glycosyltransferase
MRRLARPLLYLGTVAIVLGLAKVHARYIGDYDFTGSSRFAWTFAYIALLGIVAYGTGLPELPRSRRSTIATAVVASASGAVGSSLLQLVTGDALLPRFVVLGTAVLVVPWYVACAAVAGGARERGAERDRVLVVAQPDETARLRDELDGNPERTASIVSALECDDAAGDGGRSKPVLEAATSQRATVVVLDRDALGKPEVVAQAAALHEAGFRVRSLTQFYEDWLGKLPASELERASLLFDIGEVHRAQYSRVKRVLDLAVGSVFLVVLLLVVPFVLAANRFGNRGPLLYRQRRVGKNGRTFEMVKFRTMTPGGAPAGEWTTERDPRVTPFGRVLRRTHLDELPQAWNIVRGDLSVVGPRPEQPHYVEELVTKLPFYDLRHVVRPGLTGWAQVKYGYAGTESDALEKLQYEFFYLRHQGLALDLRIIGRTVRSVVGSAGAGR